MKRGNAFVEWVNMNLKSFEVLVAILNLTIHRGVLIPIDKVRYTISISLSLSGVHVCVYV